MPINEASSNSRWNRKRRSSKWNEERTRKLVELYEQEEVLWNVRHPLYMDEDTRKSAFSRLAKAMNVPGIEPDGIARKISIIRNSFKLEVEKIKRLSPEDASTARPPWFEVANRFLPQVFNLRKSSVNSNRDDLRENEQPMNWTAASRDELSQHSSIAEAKINANLQKHGINEASIHDGGSNPTSSNNVAGKKCHGAQSRAKIREGVQKFDNEPEDEFTHFGRNVAAQLRKLSLLDALRLQSQILAVIQDKRMARETGPKEAQKN